jgi:hypothetical protein
MSNHKKICRYPAGSEMMHTRFFFGYEKQPLSRDTFRGIDKLRVIHGYVSSRLHEVMLLKESGEPCNLAGTHFGYVTNWWSKLMTVDLLDPGQMGWPDSFKILYGK